MTKIALWWLNRRDYVCFPAGELRVALKIIEASDLELSKLYGVKRGQGHPAFTPTPVQRAREQVSRVMWILRRMTNAGAVEND